jgi:hypothetical protein
MKKTLLLFALPCALLCAADQKTEAPKETPKATALTVPAGATQVEPYLYRYQDADGKKWLYRRTPFGVVRMEDKPAAAVAVPVEAKNPITVTDQGETVKFERKTPFGPRSWTRKKTELSDDEKTLLDDSRNTEKQ